MVPKPTNTSTLIIYLSSEGKEERSINHNFASKVPHTTRPNTSLSLSHTHTHKYIALTIIKHHLKIIKNKLIIHSS